MQNDERARQYLHLIIASILSAMEGGCLIADFKADINLGWTGIQKFLEGDREGDIEIKFYLLLRRSKIEDERQKRIPEGLERNLLPDQRKE